MALQLSALSRTLQSITTIKIHELEKQRNSFKLHKENILKAVEDADNDRRKRIRSLLSVVEKLDHSVSGNRSLLNIPSWLKQSEFDLSFPDAMLEHFESQLLSKLDAQSRRLSLAYLYSRLLTEWLEVDASVGNLSVINENNYMEDSFEIVERDRLQQLRDKFAKVVFTPLETDEFEIDNYLSEMFSDDKGTKALERLRLELGAFGDNELIKSKPFDQRTIRWCIKGLLQNDLLNDEKKVILQDFLGDEIALGEVCDVLNMKHEDLENWSWNAGKEGMPVEPRRQLNGKYRIMMDEDVLQAILLHYIGVKWCVQLKESLIDRVKYGGILNNSVWPTQDEIDERSFYLGNWINPTWSKGGIDGLRKEIYRDDFLLSQLPSNVFEGAGGYDDDENDEQDSKRKSPKEIKQQLLRQLAAEVHIHRALNGEVAVVQSDLQWFATAMPHSTLIVVSRFLGIPEKWLLFFKKVLEAPLNMGSTSIEDSSTIEVRVRKRGVPMAHALEKFFGEMLLFFMDVAVNKKSQMLLYRFHDDLWLCGEPQKCAKAWEAMQEFVAVMGLELNMRKTGSVYVTQDEQSKDESILATLPPGDVLIGFLKLDSESGNWVINHKDVDAHLKQLQKQLMECSSILAWIQTWNSCIGRFFSHTFGEPAICFGKTHVDGILQTHKRIQETLFNGKDNNGKNVTEHLKRLIAERFNISDIPDAFLFMPELFGGLGLRNPFVPLFLVRDGFEKEPQRYMTEFLKREKENYADAKKSFEGMSEQERRRRFKETYEQDLDTQNISTTKDWKKFLTFEEYIRWRNIASRDLSNVYAALMKVPVKREAAMSLDVEDALDELARTQPQFTLHELDSEQKWLVQFHSKELFERCGGLVIVDKSLLPLGILTMLKKRKVSWQMVL